MPRLTTDPVTVMREPTEKQAAFIEELLVEPVAKWAAVRAGYSPRSAGSIGSENLRKPVIANAIRARVQERAETLSRQLEKLTRMTIPRGNHG